MPLSGRVAVEVDRTGKVVAGDAHLSAGAGYVGFPGIVGVPVVVDEGTLNLKLDVAAQELVFEDSSLVIGGVQTGIGGKFVPETREGVLQGLGFVVVADTRRNENKGREAGPGCFQAGRPGGCHRSQYRNLGTFDPVRKGADRIVGRGY